MNHRNITVVCWGTYDTGKPRVRLLLKAIRNLAPAVSMIECHKELFTAIEDKSQLNKWQIIRCVAKAVVAYPILLYRYMRIGTHDCILIPYMGHIDICLLWIFAAMKKKPILWDVFISLYDTVVHDRKLIKDKSCIAGILYALEWFACRAAHILFLDTHTHARYIESLYRLTPMSVSHVWVGAETACFPRQSVAPYHKPLVILFYGQFIPLHGADTIVRAAKELEHRNFSAHWILIGKGQQASAVDTLIQTLHVKSIQRIPWVPYKHLLTWIRNADICLGIFGTTDKATHVIPNKIFQICAAGRPLITADTPAVRELLRPGTAIKLIAPGSVSALSQAVVELSESVITEQTIARSCPIIDYKCIGKQIYALIKNGCHGFNSF